jgi:hypothetical protein
LAAAVVLGCDSGDQRLGRILSDGSTVAATCGLAQPAFCETFDAPSPGGRAGDLDDRVWSVARLTSAQNVFQGLAFGWAPADATICGRALTGVVPDQDYVLCGGQLVEVFDDTGGFAFHAHRIRRPFDFAGRTGTIAFDVDLKTVGHGWWIELWIVDQPVPAPHSEVPGIAPVPRNGVGLIFDGAACQAQHDTGPGTLTQLVGVEVLRDYAVAADIGREAIRGDAPCVATQDGVLNHVEVRISETRVEVHASDAGRPGSFRLLSSVDGLQLPLSRGYVNFEHLQFQAGSWAGSSVAQYHWDNIGFDGPVLPAPRGYDAPDAGDRTSDNALNTGYIVGGPSGTRPALRVTLPDVDPAGATAASLDFNASAFVAGTTIRYRFNAGAWHDWPHHYAESNGGARAESAPVDPAELHAGANLVELEASQSVVVGNLGVTVQP